MGNCKSMIDIRRATESDIDQVEKLYNDICDYLEQHENYPGWKKGIYPGREDAENGLKENALYVALENGQVVGTFMLKHESVEGYEKAEWITKSDYSHIYVIHTLAVQPNHLKHGVGERILAFTEQLAKQEQCVSLRLDVVKGNIPAELLYQKCGFHLVGTVSLGYEDFGLPWFHLYEKVL